MKLEQHIKHLCNENEFSKRMAVYKNIEDENGFKLRKNGRSSAEITNNHLSSLLTFLLSDIVVSDEESQYLLLSIVNRIYLDTSSEFSVDDHVAIDFLKKLQEILTTAKSNVLTQLVLSIISIQRLPKNAIIEVVEPILQTISPSNSQSDDIIISVISRFMEQCPEVMQLHIDHWLKLLLNLTCHNHANIRTGAVAKLKEYLPTISSNKKKIIATCAAFLKEVVLPNLNSLCAKEEILNEILSTQFPLYIEIMGEDYRRSTRLSNSLLKFVEKGFCHSEDEIKISAFKAWDCLIECFAQNKELLASTKFFKLFTQPLRLKLKTEKSTEVLIETMWKLARYLDNNLPNLFEMLCVPLFRICFKGTTGIIQPRRSSGRLSFSKQQQSPYESVQILGAEMLSHFLLPPSSQQFSFHLEPLREPFLGTLSAFARFHLILIPAVEDMICQLHHVLPPCFILNIWNHVLKCVQDGVTRKKDIDMFRSLYQSAFTIVNVNIDSDLLLSIVSSLTSFPNKILNSSLHYQSGTVAGSMHGTPVVNVLELLFSSNVRRGNLQNPKFLECAHSIITCGMERNIGNLEFIQSVVNQLRNDDEVFLNIWTFLAQQTVTYLEKSGNVNDGDSLEHGFSSLYDTLLFPLRFLFDSTLKIDSTNQAAMQSWSSLFRQFTICANQISTTKPNETREHIARHLLNKLQAFDYQLMKHPQLSFLEVTLFELFNGADFSLEKEITKSNKRKNTTQELELFGGYILLSEKLLSTIEPLFIDSPIFPPFDILPCFDVIIANLAQPLVAPFFRRISNILLEYMRDPSVLADKSPSIVCSLEKTWSKLLLRLSFTEQLFDDDRICDLFEYALLESCFYKSTADFWKMKAPDDIDVSKFTPCLRDAILEMYAKEGLQTTLPALDDAINLNVSTLSDRSLNGEGIYDTTVSESDVSAEGETSNDVAQESDDVIANVTQSEDEQITQLDKVLLSSDDDSFESRRSSRSLKLRSLASFSSSTGKSNKQNKPPYKCRKSPRLAGKNTSEVLDTDDDQVVVVETSSDDVDDVVDSTACVVITESEDDEIDEVKEILTPDAILSSQSDLLSSEKDLDSSISSTECDDTASYKDSFYSCRGDTAAAEGLDDVVEMVHVSVNVNMDDVTINSSQDNTDFFKNITPLKRSRNIKTLNVQPVTQATTDEKLRSDADEDMETNVEMVEMSVMTDPIIISDDSGLSPGGPPSVAVADMSVENERSVYEVVEMAEMSVNPDPRSPSDSNAENDLVANSSCCLDANRKDFEVNFSVADRMNNSKEGNANQVSEKYDSSVYEIVEMNDVSVNPDSLAQTDNGDSQSDNEDAQTGNIDLQTENEDAQTGNIDLQTENEDAQTGNIDLQTENEDAQTGNIDLQTENEDPQTGNTDLQTENEDAQTGNIAPQTENEDPQTENEEFKGDSLSVSKSSNCASGQISSQNISFETGHCAKDFQCYVTLVSGVHEKSIIERKSGKNLKVLSDESFSVFVRDLEVQPLNSSFETTENETNEDTQLCPEDNKDIIEDSEQQKKKVKKLQSLKANKVSTPRRGRKPTKMHNTRHRRKKVDSEPESITDEVVFSSQTQSVSVQDITVNNDADEKVSEQCDSLTPTICPPALNGSGNDINQQTTGDILDLGPEETIIGDVDVSLETANSDLRLSDVIHPTSKVESPQASERKTEDVETPRSCLGKRLTCMRGDDVSPSVSPSGILKKRVTDSPSPANKTRRVSFAEPISTSTSCPPNPSFRSPRSSPRYLKKARLPNKLVSRRLSLPLPHRTSPMSVRSANIAAVIADIKSRNGETNQSEMAFTSTRSPTFDIGSIRLSQLNDDAFINTLNLEQLDAILQTMLNCNPVLYSAFVKKLKDS